MKFSGGGRVSDDDDDGSHLQSGHGDHGDHGDHDY